MFRTFVLILIFSITLFAQKNTIYLSWNDVVEKSISDNLLIKSKILEQESQNYELWRSYSNYLPTLRYQGTAVKNLELPTMVFMGQAFTIGTNYTFQHSLDLTLPVFTGGSRFFTIRAQSYMKRSLSEELKGMEQETALQALQAYFGVILAEELRNSAIEAVQVADSNLSQVKIFYEEGTATELDLQRAQAQYYSVLPQYESAQANWLLSHQQLKMILNISLDDSVVVNDSLVSRDFLNNLKGMDLSEYKATGLQNRPELRALSFQAEAAGEGERIALSQFAPVVAVSAGVQHQAFLDNSKIKWSDYTRSKSIALSVSWPLFEGGRSIIDYQQAKIRSDQLGILQKQTEQQFSLEVEQNYYRFNETVKTLRSLEEAMKQSKESLRLSNLLYSEGMSTQIDVLNAQLLYNSSHVQFLQGIYNYNIQQLQLMKSIGKLNTIWNQ